MRRYPMFLAFAVLLSFSSISANQSPVANAGPDTTFKINYTIRLQGDATDDSTSVDFLAFAWTQIAGPAQANILSTETQFSRVTFPQMGEYTFQLSVSDGQLSDADTVKYTIIDSLPFIILNPVDNEQIQIGYPYTVRWRMDPSRPCRVEYSLNEGISFQILSLSGAVSDSFVWNVGSEYLDSARQGIIKVIQYPTGPLEAFGTFVLVDHPPDRVVVPLASPSPSLFRPSLTPDGRLFLPDLPRDRPARLRLLGSNGSVLLDAMVTGRNALNAGSVLQTGRVIVCEVSDRQGQLRAAKLFISAAP